MKQIKESVQKQKEDGLHTCSTLNIKGNINHFSNKIPEVYQESRGERDGRGI
jgi:hypothetical protein